jgi:hypothetical protein
MHYQESTRPPAPELSPDQFLTVIEFGIHEPEYAS